MTRDGCAASAKLTNLSSNLHRWCAAVERRGASQSTTSPLSTYDHIDGDQSSQEASTHMRTRIARRAWSLSGCLRSIRAWTLSTLATHLKWACNKGVWPKVGWTVLPLQLERARQEH
jgi:hypothetical protein